MSTETAMAPDHSESPSHFDLAALSSDMSESRAAVRAVLENYADLLEVLPHRVVVRCHRITERRMLKIMHGVRQPHDVEVIAL